MDGNPNDPLIQIEAEVVLNAGASVTLQPVEARSRDGSPLFDGSAQTCRQITLTNLTHAAAALLPQGSRVYIGISPVGK